MPANGHAMPNAAEASSPPRPQLPLPPPRRVSNGRRRVSPAAGPPQQQRRPPEPGGPSPSAARRHLSASRRQLLARPGALHRHGHAHRREGELLRRLAQGRGNGPAQSPPPPTAALPKTGAAGVGRRGGSERASRRRGLREAGQRGMGAATQSPKAAPGCRDGWWEMLRSFTRRPFIGCLACFQKYMAVEWGDTVVTMPCSSPCGNWIIIQLR